MGVLDIEPGQSPEAPGTLSFFRQGFAESTGFRANTEGQVLAPGNDSLLWPAGEFAPPDHGYKGWSFDPALASSSNSVTNGTLYLVKHPIRADASLTAISWSLFAAAVSPVAGQNWVAAYSAAGVRLGQTGVDAAVAGSGVVETAVAATLSAADRFFWAAFLFNAATPPQLARASTFSSTPNAGLTATGYRFCVNGTALTTAPASITPASNSLTGPLTLWSAWK